MQHPKYIHDLITRFFKRELNNDELDALHAWLKADPTNRSYFDKANERQQARTALKEFTSERIDAGWAKFSRKMHKQENHQAKKVVFLRRNNWWAVAATFALLILGYILTRSISDRPTLVPERIVVNNPQSRNTFILLPDSTMVWLNANSTLEYNSQFALTNREVRLKGEAFFDVRKKQRMDFVVTTDHVLVQVKGTRFNVRAFHGEDANTTLEEGKVELRLKNAAKTYRLNPGDHVTVNKSQSKIIFRKVDTSNYTAWKEDRLVFDNTPLSEIVLKLENRYKKIIEVDDRIARQERLTMTIQSESIEEVLDMIKLSSNLQWKQDQTKFLIYE